MPARSELPERLGADLHVLYLVFNEGYATTAGPNLQRVELSAEAIRLARLVHQLLPGDSEATALLALMLLTDSPNSRPTHGWRRTTGSTPSGRTCWRWPARPKRRSPPYMAAAQRTASIPQQRYLQNRAARLSGIVRQHRRPR